MTVVTTLDVHGLTPEEYRAAMDKLGVEESPEPGIYMHISTPIEDGYRIVEVWDHADGFNAFVERRMVPALQAAGIDRSTDITITPLHNLFVPRLAEMPGLIDALPGSPAAAATVG
jgi:hypothetical protein